MGIQQVLHDPRGALRLDPKQIAVVTTLDAREGSLYLPPLPFRNGRLVVALLSWSRVAKATLVCSRTAIPFNF